MLTEPTGSGDMCSNKHSGISPTHVIQVVSPHADVMLDPWTRPKGVFIVISYWNVFQ